MAEKIVYFVPGLAESTLSAVVAPFVEIWLSVPVCILGTFGGMRLAGNGIDPGPPDGIHLQASGLLGPYAGFPTAQLVFQFPLGSWNVKSYPWDWRKSILDAGDSLATVIRNEVDPSEPCRLICHSAGGLVARRAWSNLLATGEHSLIARIVAIGTPHWGSYSVVSGFSGSIQLIDTLYAFNQGVGSTIGGLASVIGYQAWTKLEIRDLILSWPCLYELLPSLLQPGASADPNRVLLFDVANWDPSVVVSQTWLTHARTVFQPWAASAASMPPDDVLITVAGYTYSTPDTLQSTSGLGVGTILGSTGEGDSVVTHASGQLSGSTRYSVSSQHQDQYPQAVNNGNAHEWLTVAIARTPTPAPEVVLPALNPQQLPVLPPGPSWSPFGLAAACQVGRCGC